MNLYVRNRHFFIIDILLIPLAIYLSYVLRLETFAVPPRWLPGMAVLIIACVVATPIIFRATEIYARFWRYASVEELTLLIGAWTVGAMVASLMAYGVGTLAPGFLLVPRSIPFILLLLGLVATAGPRLFVRVLSYRLAGDLQWSGGAPTNVAIMGAGDAGAMMARELEQNPQLGLRAVGFLDDNTSKHKMVIHGLPVLGDRSEIANLAKSYDVSQVFIAMPTAPGKEIRTVVALCEEAGVQAKIVPGVFEVLSGRVNVSNVRNVQIEDLLRREPIETDTAAVRRLLSGKRVLVTGGGGSIGSELARQVLRCEPAEIMLLGHGENSIFRAYHELRMWQNQEGAYSRDGGQAGQPGVPIVHPVVADIRMPKRLQAILESFRPEVIFHAAAHKHVPLMEINAADAILNNIIGTRTLLQAAAAAGVPKFVMISTDKAVYPSSVMGATKRIAELLVHHTAVQHNLAYVAVRFGNVLGSRGSVIETFRKQIALGGPVTVTHPDMRRYFMTIPEAVQLVLQASVLGTGGEVFVLDMGDPVRIVDLASDLVRLSGLEVGRDIDIVFSGLRPGEKLYEELFLTDEKYSRTTHEQIFIAANAGGLVPADLELSIATLHQAALDNDEELIASMLGRLVPGMGANVVRNGHSQETDERLLTTANASAESPKVLSIAL